MKWCQGPNEGRRKSEFRSERRVIARIPLGLRIREEEGTYALKREMLDDYLAEKAVVNNVKKYLGSEVHGCYQRGDVRRYSSSSSS